MNELRAEFVELKELPIPKTRKELLLVDTGKVIEPYRPTSDCNGGWEFNLVINPNHRYFHFKVVPIPIIKDLYIGIKVRYLAAKTNDFIATVKEIDTECNMVLITWKESVIDEAKPEAEPFTIDRTWWCKLSEITIIANETNPEASR